MKETKVEAKTIQDAVEIGLIELGLRRDQVEVVVVSEGTKGILGFGAKKACVMLREKRWTGSGSGAREESRGNRERGFHSRGRNDGPSRNPQRRDRYEAGNRRPERPQAPRPVENRRPAPMPEKRPEAVYQEISLAMDKIEIPENPLEHAKLAFETSLKLMGIQATLTLSAKDEKDEVVTLKFDSPDAAVFTADNARGLQSLQFLINSIVNKTRKSRCSVRIDTADYWHKKEEELAVKVEAAAKEVASTSRPLRLEPMPAHLRKFVHGLIKSKYPEVETISEGEGKWRKVVIRPVSQKETAGQQ